MRIRAVIPLAVFLAAGAAGGATPVPAAAEGAIRVGGTGGALGLMRALGEAWGRIRPGPAVEVLRSLGSNGALRALGEGAIDVAVATRPPGGRALPDRLDSRPFARTALVFSASPGTPAVDLTMETVASIYRGDLRRWPGGGEIRLVLRPRHDTDTLLLAAFSPAMEDAVAAAGDRPGMLIGVTAQEAAEMVETVPGALGMISLSLVRAEGRAVTPLRLDGVAPGTAALRDGSYPLVKVFDLVIRKDAPVRVRDFVDFCVSAENAPLLKAAGAVPERNGVR